MDRKIELALEMALKDPSWLTEDQLRQVLEHLKRENEDLERQLEFIRGELEQYMNEMEQLRSRKEACLLQLEQVLERIGFPGTEISDSLLERVVHGIPLDSSEIRVPEKGLFGLYSQGRLIAIASLEGKKVRPERLLN